VGPAVPDSLRRLAAAGLIGREVGPPERFFSTK